MDVPAKKPCNKCGIPKALDDFHLHSKSKDGHSNTCKLCAIEITRNWYSQYRNEVNERRRQERLDNGEAIRAKEREDYKGKRGEQKRASSARYNLKHPERVKASKQKTFKKNYQREEFRLKQHAKSMIQRAKSYDCRVIEYFTILEIAERDGWVCHVCHGKVTRKNWSVDHIIPLVQRGPHTRANVQLAHKRCNSRRAYGLLPGQFPLFP